MTHLLTRIESALQEGNVQLANVLLMETTDQKRTKIYYQIIRDGLVATFRHLESSSGGYWSEWDSFCYCSNALLELAVKNVPIPANMEVLAMYKLSSYGLRRLCGSPIAVERKIDWRDSILWIVRWVEELHHRTKCYDFLDVDDQVTYRIRMIHNHLFFVKNRCELRGLPLNEMIFCLTIFARIHHQDSEYLMYRTVVNKRIVMQFLVAIVSRLKGIINPNEESENKKSSVLKKLIKIYRKLKKIHSVNKVMRYVRIHREFGAEDFKRSSASMSLAAFKRFNQVCGEAIKNSTQTPNLTAKLNTFLSGMLTDAITLNSKFRNLSCHGFPLSQLHRRESDDMVFYRNLTSFIQMTAEIFYCISFFNLIDCYRNMFGLIRRCRTIEELCALVRYLGSSTIRLPFKSEVTNDIKFNRAFEELLDTYGKLLMEVEMMAFANAPIAAIHNHLYAKLTNKSVFDVLMADGKLPSQQNISKHQYYIQRHMELIRDTSYQWLYREKTRQILMNFTSESELGTSTFAALENKLHSVLSKARKGYYHNLFSLDLKTQAIKESLRTYLIGQKSSCDFKMRNKDFKSKFASLRHQDEIELNAAFQKIIENLRDAFKRSNCDSINRLIKNSDTIPLKQHLAIEYWQLQAMEILSSSGYFGDNFQVLSKSVPMIWGRSYRNYLAHDSVSYDLLTCSGSLKVLINGFVLAFESSELNVFSRSPKFHLDGLVCLETQGFQWLEVQSQLLECVKNCDMNQLASCLHQGAEFSGRFLMPLGELLHPMLFDLRMIVSHDQLDRSRIVPAIHEFMNQFYSDINQAMMLNHLQINNLSIQEALQQFEHLQPAFLAPCIGTVLPHLVSTGNIQLLEELVDRYVGSERKSIHRMTASCMFLDPNCISNFPLQGQFSIVVTQNNVALFKDLVYKCCDTDNPGSGILKPIMESCCHHGRLEMVQSILDSGFKCDQYTLSNCLKRAIDQRHWKIADLLLSNSCTRFDEDMLLQVVAKRNFGMMRRMLAEPIPADSVGKIVEEIVRSGSKRLLSHLDKIGVDIWTCNNILSSALCNKNLNVLEYLEDMIYMSDKSIYCYDGISFWNKMFRDVRTLAILFQDPDFVSNMILKPPIVKRWITKIANLLKIDETHFSESFHFMDNIESCSWKLTKMHSADNNRVIHTCKQFSRLIQSLPQNLFVIEQLISATVKFLEATILITIQLTLYSTTIEFECFDDHLMITHDCSLSIAETMTKALRSNLLKIPHLQLANATITAVNDQKFQRLLYIQIESHSCILQQSSWNQLSLPVLFNKPGVRNILHQLQSDTSSTVLSSILQLGADPAHLNDRYETPFHTALAKPFPLLPIKIMYLHHEKSHESLKTNLFNHIDLDGNSPLQAAVATHSYEVVEFMLQYGADPKLANRRGEGAILAHAILGQNVRMVELLLRNCPSLLKLYVTEDRSTALEVAVKINHDHIVRLLLERGADLNHRNGTDCTVLNYAIEYEAVESLHTMLDFAFRRRICVDNDVDGQGTTALEYAYKNGSCLEILRVLICHSIKQEFSDLIELGEKYGLT